jgi:hypothetical protein
MPVKVSIVRGWDLKALRGLQAGLLEMATDIDRRAKAIAPKDTRALVNSGVIEPSRLSNTYTVRFGSDKVPYARRRHFENNKNPQSKGYLAKAGESVARGAKEKYFRNKV